MKPIVPKVSIAVWKELYAAAARTHALRPWEALGDTDLIGVRDPSNGDTGFGMFMGIGGTLFGFCLYLGAEGFDVYRRMMDGSFDPEDDDVYAVQNCLKLEFGVRNDLLPEDHAVIRQLGLSFKGNHAWLQFRSLLPRFAPWFLTEDEARFLTLGLNAACHHHEQIVKGNVDESLRSSEILVYSAVARDSAEGVPRDSLASLPGKYQSQWEPLPAYAPSSAAPPVLNLARINAIRAKQMKPDPPWEASMIFIPSAIADYERPYYMRLAAVCQQRSAFAFAAEPALPRQTNNQARADAICSLVEKSGFLLETIFVRTTDEAAALASLAKALGCAVRQREHLDAVRGFKRVMRARFVGGRG